MKLHNMLPFRRSIWIGTALLSTILGANALSQEYCSTQNTGSSFDVVTDIYQSNGACQETCGGQYAFAIVQWQSCWCSNYIPAQQADVSNCNKNCPGYPDEQCGNPDTGYFGYIALGSTPSGTAGAAVVASTSSPSPSSTPQSSTEDPETSLVSETVVQTVTQDPSPSVLTSYVTPTTSSTSTPPPTTTSSTKTTSTSAPVEIVASPVTSVIMTTISGAVVTQTVTSTPMVAPGSHSDNIQFQRENGLGAGAIAGIVIGALAGVAVIALAAFLLWRRRRNSGDDEKQASSLSGSKNMQRNVSVLSKAGLLGRTRPSTGDRDYDEPYGMTGNNSVRHSMLFAGADGISPVSPLDSSHSGSGGSRRLSKPMVYDQRLNPSALFANQEANGSRISMQDTQDYSRPLGVMNPDPRSSFESRLSHQ